MEENEKNISADSTKQELLGYFDNFFSPLFCANPKHRYQFLEICLKQPDHISSNPHQPYQLLCHSCKRENSYQCTEEKHPIAELVDILRHLIE